MLTLPLRLGSGQDARTREQGYHGPADWQWIKRVKEVLSIPVIANGDIVSGSAAINCLEFTQADGVMCSRGTLGYPYLVGEIDYYLKTGKKLPKPTPSTWLRASSIDLLSLAKEHLQDALAIQGTTRYLASAETFGLVLSEFYRCGGLARSVFAHRILGGGL